MSEKDILAKLRTSMTCHTIDGVDVLGHPDDALCDLLKDAADEIERLRALCGTADIGPSFREITKDLPRHEPSPESLDDMPEAAREVFAGSSRYGRTR